VRRIFGILLITVFLLTGFSFLISAQEVNYEEVDGVFNPNEYENTMYVEALEMEIGWLVKDNNLVFAVKTVGMGWAAVGFDPSTMMRDANIIIGDVTEEGSVNIEDHFGVSNTGHRADEVRNILQAAGSENEEGTVIEFVIPLDSGDDMDRKLETDQEYKVILAYHMSSSSFKIRHSNRTSVNIQL